MLTLLFIILMFGIFGKMIGLAFRATWGITKICFRLVFLPLVLEIPKILLLFSVYGYDR